jgi:hypothetical protein
MARKGYKPSAIGVALRDQHGIPQVRFVTGNKILRILKSQGMSPFILRRARGNVILTGRTAVARRSWTQNPRGPVVSDQKGGCRTKALGDEPQGQGLEVPLDLDRVAHSPSCALL